MNDRIGRAVADALLQRIRIGTLAIAEAGEDRAYGFGAPAAAVAVHDSRTWQMLLRGSRGLAESYADGLWDSPDLVALIRLAAKNVHMLDRVRARLAPIRVPLQRARAVLTSNTRRRSRRDIAAHYDLGNQLFERMLDPTMAYSCALFERPTMTLEEAQIAKFERICEMLELTREDRLLEIGTGWGGLAIHAAATRGCEVTTTTISREQRDYARAKIEQAGLSDQITVLLEDYRDLRGRYDKLVSVEMIEAVGWRHFGTFVSRCSQLLDPRGAMLLQAIVIDDCAYEVEKASRSFINTYIFPNGCLPSVQVIANELARRTDLRTDRLEDLTPHYVETLRRWRTNFAHNALELHGLGYDARFQRLWTLYLAYCEAGFAERRIRLVQQVLSKPQRLNTRAVVRSSSHAGPRLAITASRAFPDG